MARRKDGKRKRKKSGRGGDVSASDTPTYTPRRDWSKITFYVFSITIVLSMVCSLFIYILPT